jgi:hypothetical protein
MDMTLITGTISGLKAASDIAKSLLDIKKASDISGKVAELQSVILSAQSSAIEANSAQFAMIEEIRNLKEEMTRIKAWDTEKQRYHLTSPWPGTVVYSLKESMSNGEPPHWICTNCYNSGTKSILTQQQDGNSRVSFLCPKCKVSFQAIGHHRSGYNLIF